MQKIVFALLVLVSASAQAITFSFSPTGPLTVQVGESLDFTLSATLTGSESLIGFDFISSLTPDSFTLDLADWDNLSDFSLSNNVTAASNFSGDGDLTVADSYTIGTLTYTFNTFGNFNLALTFDDVAYTDPDSGASDVNFDPIFRTNIILPSTVEIDVVPEPGLLLASVGALGFLAARRRRQVSV